MSASIHSTHSPRAVATPRLRWALRSGPPISTTSARRAAISPVRSVLELSTTRSSSGWWSCARIERRHASRVRSTSRVVTTTDTRGPDRSGHGSHSSPPCVVDRGPLGPYDGDQQDQQADTGHPVRPRVGQDEVAAHHAPAGPVARHPDDRHADEQDDSQHRDVADLGAVHGVPGGQTATAPRPQTPRPTPARTAAPARPHALTDDEARQGRGAAAEPPPAVAAARVRAPAARGRRGTRPPGPRWSPSASTRPPRWCRTGPLVRPSRWRSRRPRAAPPGHRCPTGPTRAGRGTARRRAATAPGWPRRAPCTEVRSPC